MARMAPGWQRSVLLSCRWMARRGGLVQVLLGKRDGAPGGDVAPHLRRVLLVARGRTATCGSPAPAAEISRRGCARDRQRLGGSFRLETSGQWNDDLDNSAAALSAGFQRDGAAYQLCALAHADDAEAWSQR